MFHAVPSRTLATETSFERSDQAQCVVFRPRLPPPAVCARYEDLLGDVDLKDVAERAFGREGLGIVVVTGVPDVSDLSRELFKLGRR